MVKPAKGSKPDKLLLQQLYVKESKSIREIAESLGCTKDMVFRSLQDYGIETRTNKRRSQLKDIRLFDLEKEVKRKGIRGYARELGVDESTLRHHLKIRRISR
jgi:DNA-binding CsgD family transcriptional regulator